MNEEIKKERERKRKGGREGGRRGRKEGKGRRKLLIVNFFKFKRIEFLVVEKF